VRRVRLTGEAEFTPPAEFERWHEEALDGTRTWVLRGAADAWTTLDLPPGAVVEGLSLEDAFIACVGARVTAL
jgi:hypothetical protein